MASSSILRHAAQQNVRRSLQLSAASIGRRHIGQKYLAKVKQAEEQWAEKAQRIHKGEEKGMLDILEERGFVHQIVGYILLPLQRPRTYELTWL
jgi:tyrosyl-tRNA synthetase